MALMTEFFGGKPNIPQFIPVNAQAIQQQTLTGNTAALPATIEQTAAINAAQFSNIDKLLAQATGGYYDRIRNSIGKNTADLVAGVIPDDVSVAVRNNAASRALYGGFGGSGAANNLAARDLGLTSLELMSRGFDSATKWMNAISNTYQPVSVASMFARNTYDLPTALSHAVNERNAAFQREYIEKQWSWYGSFGQQAIRFEDSALQLAGDLAGAVGSIAGAACWVAREVFGESDPRWKFFRFWLFNRAPVWFRNFYLKYGEGFAKWIHNKPALKSIIRKWMESRIATLEVSHGLV